ncbi:hypothetical protein BAE44_0002361 [Dichanthelium oligosanthes]|uniref:Uncharacterized protein n=1 Tax=Dichanthelium oligosanthes TaxID=888268 RepID=A0A1E5WGW6_9POAL|nr:hypothetical protein BAE44_0002361 [Dichanthelium oligosanthes]
MDMEPCTLVGNRICCLAAESKSIVKYDLGHRKFAFFHWPLAYQGRGVLMPAMGGGLGAVLELNTLPGLVPFEEPAMVGFAEGLGVIFVRTGAGVYSINLKSGRVKKMSSRSI